jgi:UDP-N-acetylmuramate--alanine ligase
VQRRLQIKGERRKVLVIDDYGHHPTEIRATLSALRDAVPGRRLVVLFQPHRFTRTKGLFKEFHTAFHAADILVMTEIYSAGEQPIENITAAGLLESIQQHGQRQTYLVPEVNEVAKQVLPMLAEGDVVLTLGAGDIWQAGERLLDLLNADV